MEDFLVEEDEEGGAAVVLILYVLKSVKIRDLMEVDWTTRVTHSVAISM